MNFALASLARLVSIRKANDPDRTITSGSRWEPMPLPPGYPLEPGLIAELEDDTIFGIAQPMN